MSENLKKMLGETLEDALKMREDLGLSKAKVAYVKRTWTGKRPGEGSPKDERIEISPSPTIMDYSHKMAIVQAGAIQQGDLILKHMSKENFDKPELLNMSDNDKEEKFWEVDGTRYKGVSVTDEIYYWSVQIRPVSGG